MKRTGIPAYAHSTNDPMPITAQHRTAEAVQVPQTIRPTHDTHMRRRRSRAGIRPVRTLILR
ncbi:hypothetical protein WR30_09765 [Burkholderia contaminans FFH2055]|nr:hypothetical protein WR30_09765 [Burkholderia contaminans FFH2055]